MAWLYLTIAETLDGHWRNAGFWALLTLIYLALILIALTVPSRDPDD